MLLSGELKHRNRIERNEKGQALERSVVEPSLILPGLLVAMSLWHGVGSCSGFARLKGVYVLGF